MPSKPTLLLLDYPGRRPEAHLADLRLESHGFDCRHLLTPPLPGEVSTLEYTRQLTGRSDLPESGAIAVLSYCASAPLAAAVATELGTDRPLPIVFFDPSQCHRHHIVNGYDAAVRQIEGKAPPADRRPLLDIASGIAQPARLIEEIAEDLTARAKIALAAAEFDELETAEPLEYMIGMYVQWLTYLLAVHHRAAATPMGEVLHVVSRNHPDDLGWLGIGDIRTVRIGCDRAALACSAETRNVVLVFVEELVSRNRPE